MAYKIKGSWKFNAYVDCGMYTPDHEDTATVAISFANNDVQYIGIDFEYGNSYTMYYRGDSDHNLAYMEPYWEGLEYQTIDFGDEYQEIDETFYNFITSSATPITGFIQKPIVINVTSPEGVTLATEKTIINQNIKVTIDESLTGGYSSGYNSGFADGQESITKNIKVIERTVTSNGAIKLTDVSEVPHKIQVQVNLDGVEDPSAVKLQRYGKNLADISKIITLSSNYNDAVVDGDKVIMRPKNGQVYGFIIPDVNLIVGETYTFSIQDISDHGSAWGWRLKYKDGTYSTSPDNKAVRTMLIEKEAQSIYFYVGMPFATQETIIVSKPQIELGAETSYEPFTDPVEYSVNEDGNVLVDILYPCTTIIANAHITATYQKSYGMHKMLVALNDNRQQSGKRADYSQMYFGWDSSWFYPRYDLIPTKISYTFRAMVGDPFDLAERLNECGVVLDTSKSTEFNWCFFSSSRITRIPELNTTSAAALNQVFYSCTGLRTIDKLILKDDGSQTFSDTFRSTTALENIIIEGVIGQNKFNTQYSTKLSKASITSIVNALSTTTSGLTVTFSLTAVKNAFETSTGAADGNTSDEWKALTATRSNWTFSLV